MDYIQIGIAKGLISFNSDITRITYTNRNNTYSLKDPEETVRGARTQAQRTRRNRRKVKGIIFT